MRLNSMSMGLMAIMVAIAVPPVLATPNNASAAVTAVTAPAGPETVRGTVQKVQGGRVMVRLDDGRVLGYSVTPGMVKEGQRIQAQTARVGDAVRLNQIQVLR